MTPDPKLPATYGTAHPNLSNHDMPRSPDTPGTLKSARVANLTCELDLVADSSPKNFSSGITAILRDVISGIGKDQYLIGDGNFNKVYRDRAGGTGGSPFQPLALKLASPVVRRQIVQAEKGGFLVRPSANPLDVLKSVLQDGPLPGIPELLATVLTPKGATVAAVLTFMNGLPILDAIENGQVTFNQTKGLYKHFLDNLAKCNVRHRNPQLGNIWICLPTPHDPLSPSEPMVTVINPADLKREPDANKIKTAELCALVFYEIEVALKSRASG